MSITNTADLNSSAGSGGRLQLAVDTTYYAGALDPVRTWVAQWGTELQVLGGVIIGLCLVLVGIKASGKAALSNGGGGSSGMRETFGSVLLLVVAGILIGAALIVGPLFLDVGSSSNAAPAAVIQPSPLT